MTKKISRILGTILILINLIYFIPLTIKIVISNGGSWGYGFVALPITIVSNLFAIPATLTWIDNTESQLGFLITNTIGTAWTLFWLTLFLSTPK